MTSPREATLYWSTTAPTKGWWVASVPTIGRNFVIVKVLRDGQHDSTTDAIMRAASSAVPEVRKWTRAATGPLRWTGYRTAVAS